MRMHPGQLTLDSPTVAALVDAQLPQCRGMPVRPVPSDGTVTMLFRVGDEVVLRFPLQPGDVDATRSWLQAEARAARRLLGRLPVPTPEPLALGEPGPGYPLPWAAYRWLPGTVATHAGVGDSPRLATGLARVVLAVRRVGTGGRTFTGAGRGGHLTAHDAYVASGLDLAREMVDTAALAELWDRLRSTPRAAPDTCTHGDLMPGNLLVDGDRLIGVLDVGGLAPADPALDLMPAWNLLDTYSRNVFRNALDVGDDDWDRGKGWALAQAIGCLSYYRVTNPVMSTIARRTLLALLDDERRAGRSRPRGVRSAARGPGP